MPSIPTFLLAVYLDNLSHCTPASALLAHCSRSHQMMEGDYCIAVIWYECLCHRSHYKAPMAAKNPRHHQLEDRDQVKLELCYCFEKHFSVFYNINVEL